MSSYKVTVNGKSCTLPPRTLSVDEKIESIQDVGKRYAAGEISRRECVLEQYEFVQSLTMPAVIGVDVEEVDTNDLLKWVLDIITAYNAPVYKAQADAKMAAVKDYVNSPEMSKATKALEAARGVK